MSITKLLDKRIKWGILRHTKTGHILTDFQGSGNTSYRLYPFAEYVSEPGVNYLVAEKLEIGDIERGQSAAGLRVKGEHQEYYMSVGNMAELLRAVADGRIGLFGGKFCGLFTFTKQGQNVSLTPAK
jgi:hypothetical protein